MELYFDVDLPYNRGKIVEKYLKTLKEKEKYDAWSITDDLEVVKCRGSIENNGSYNYHNNYDDSENELFVIFKNSLKTKRWFSLNKNEVVAVQKNNIKKWKKILEKELKRVNKISK